MIFPPDIDPSPPLPCLLGLLGSAANSGRRAVVAVTPPARLPPKSAQITFDFGQTIQATILKVKQESCAVGAGCVKIEMLKASGTGMRRACLPPHLNVESGRTYQSLEEHVLSSPTRSKHSPATKCIFMHSSVEISASCT